MSSRGEILTRYELEGVKVIGEDEGSAVNGGSYGFVFEVEMGDNVFMAKKPHTIFLTNCSQEESNTIAQKFREECILLSQLKHPNIVKFIGVYYGNVMKTDLILVMEKLHSDLVHFLANNPQPDLSLKLSILRDVARGLAYLHEHSPPVVHRDLTAMNVLLTVDNTAKISDVGMSKMMDDRAKMATRHTRVPGQQYYMPPETLLEKAECTPKLDIFSFGHLTLHLAIGDFPKVYEIPHGKKKEGIIEQQKRDKSLDAMGSSHCMYDLTLNCLRDSPNERPSAIVLLKYLEKIIKMEKLSDIILNATDCHEFNSLQTDDNVPQLQVMVAGLPRTGKSTCLNNIFDLKFPARTSAKPVTMAFNFEDKEKYGISLTVIDTPTIVATPSLKPASASNDAILLRKEKKINEKNIILILVLSVFPTHITTNDYHSMLKNLTTIFGNNIWNLAIVLLTFSDTAHDAHKTKSDSGDQHYEDYIKENCTELQKILANIGIKKAVKPLFEYISLDHFKHKMLDGIIAIPVGRVPDISTKVLFPLQPWTHTFKWTDFAFMEIVKLREGVIEAIVNASDNSTDEELN